MPYRVDVDDPDDDALDRLVELGALDLAQIGSGLAAILPDHVSVAEVQRLLRTTVHVAPARGRDENSVWVLKPRAVRVGRFLIVPADAPHEPGALRLADGAAFGTGLHASTALCLEALDDELNAPVPQSALDVGTGSGVLALAALRAGVRRVVAIDIDQRAVHVAAENARLNDLRSQLTLVCGHPESLGRAWPLVMANVLAAPLIEMAPTLVRRVGRGGRLILSGVRFSLAREVEHAYARLGMRQVRSRTRDAWTVLTLHASW